MTRRIRYPLVALLLAAAAGCGPEGQVTLYLPQADGELEEIELEGSGSGHAVENGVDRIVLRWPLPGTAFGRTAFELYLRVPPQEGKFAMGEMIRDDTRIIGLFYQRIGRMAGCTVLSQGTITLDEEAEGLASRRGTIDLTCDDGTRLRGTFQAEPESLDLRRFEEKHEADIKYAMERAGQTTPPNLTDRPAATESPLAPPIDPGYKRDE